MIDAKELCANLTTDMIGTTAFGLNIDSLNNPECEFRKNRKMIFDDTIKHRMKSGEKRNDLIDILIELKKQCVDEDLRDFSEY
ncbi:PREDICTED: probable cytochrome P450 6g2 [Dinoponera quadriceps]|uniref:Probable cytochrome P450 6g2 n=1 Tax=Dinoponera quadriceps TaxID=609295 RepID=A0A6P3YBL4_DINQU|nr:PREDICTED: probable cytochrome P450 6g2 [Dinoponera quadriceps]